MDHPTFSEHGSGKIIRLCLIHVRFLKTNHVDIVRVKVVPQVPQIFTAIDVKLQNAEFT